MQSDRGGFNSLALHEMTEARFRWVGVNAQRDHLSLFGGTINLPSGTRVVVEGVLMAVVLIVRPSGLTGGREFSLPRLRRRRA